MNPGRRSFLTYFYLCVAPLLLLAALNYWNGLRNVNRTIADSAQDDLNALTADVDKRVQEQESEIRRLVSSTAIVEFLTATANGQTQTALPPNLAASVAAVLSRAGNPFKLSLFDRDRILRLQAERPLAALDPTNLIIRTTDFKSQTFPPDISESQEFTQVANTSTWRYAARVFGEPNAARGAVLIAELDLGEVFIDRAQASDSSMIVAWDRDGRIVYHSQRPLHGQSIRNALPSLANVAQAQSSGLHSLETDNKRDYVLAFAPLPRLNITVAAGRDRFALVSSAHRWGIAGLVMAIALAGAAASLIDKVAHRRSTGIARVTEGLTAVAKGELDHRVELRSSDEARSMADNLNILAERIRTQYTREAEARQFESFFRLSAMLTHDLKNSIEALSLIVSNMEKHFDNEQFRVDAMKSLTSATDKLRAIVARLSRPVTSLSGEHKLPRKVDVVPILKRSIKATAEPAANQHQINVELPDELYAVVDADRLEEVFENLILNAIEAMGHKRGTLTIAADKTATGQPKVTFTDNGCGMSENFLKESLFRPFRTTKKAGVGLGLYTCREVVAASGGSIEVESAEGVGTTFRVVLPSSS